MDHRYIVGINDEEIVQGKLFEITKTIEDEFAETCKRVIEDRKANPSKPAPKKVQMVIDFLDPLAVDIEEQYNGCSEVLYLNEHAKKVLEKRGIRMSILGEIDSLPKNTGAVMSMPRYLV